MLGEEYHHCMNPEKNTQAVPSSDTPKSFAVSNMSNRKTPARSRNAFMFQ
jgi:hypothetical protein